MKHVLYQWWMRLTQIAIVGLVVYADYKDQTPEQPSKPGIAIFVGIIFAAAFTGGVVMVQDLSQRFKQWRSTRASRRDQPRDLQNTRVRIRGD